MNLTPICLAGPTGSGKTAAALAIADFVPMEIISVDSALVYRGMDIGTAKPSAAELAKVPHHLIDILDPSESFSAAEFVKQAQTLVKEIQSRGKLPVLVGGTMLYFKALFVGLSAMPQADAELRAEIDAEAAERGWPALHADLAKLDPATAERLAPNDSQRIQRALEVIRLTGLPMSTLHAERSEGVNWPLFSLEPSNRDWLHQRLAVRFRAMLDAGFVTEVRRLRERGDLSLALPSMRCVGYRQIWELLEDKHMGVKTDGRIADEVFDKGLAATRQLAKRQITWLRSMPERRIVACDGKQPVAELLAGLHRLLA